MHMKDDHMRNAKLDRFLQKSRKVRADINQK